MRRLLAHPALPSLTVFAAIAIGGFVSMLLGWRVAARTLNVAAQLPAVVSGGIGGLMLVVIGTSLFVAQVGRLRSAEERAEADELLDRTSEVVQALRVKQPAHPEPAARSRKVSR